MSGSVSRVLSQSQLDMLAKHGREQTAEVGDVLFKVGDKIYPFIAIREGEVTILDANDHEVVRQETSGFLGEMNLLSGQTVFLTAVVSKPSATSKSSGKRCGRCCSRTAISPTCCSRPSCSDAKACRTARAWGSTSSARPTTR